MNDFDISDRAERPEDSPIACWYDADASGLEHALSFTGITARDIVTVEELTTIFDAPLPF